MKVLVTGGAGFVGSSLAREFQENLNAKVCVMDNLKRRGSEINLADFQKRGIAFIHGDIRNPSDFESIEGQFDLFIEASAEPSVLAGTQGSPKYLVDTNLVGTTHCLEFAKNRAKSLIFLSTSRVYSIEELKSLTFKQQDLRLECETENASVSREGVKETFSVKSPRSLYGTTKLASELLVEEYSHQFGINAVIDRCGVIAGRGQFGKVDQGVFTLWIAKHFFGGELGYFGFGGKGHQVRDLLHPKDLYDLILKQINSESRGEVYNVGGGREISVSLAELTQIAQKLTSREIPIKSISETSAVDIPWFVTDSEKVKKKFDWLPSRDVEFIFSDIYDWLRANENQLQTLFS